ncbi:hypothetical protein JRQ81_010768 [Phrynocephalus forsythii]|uniref:Uncharacterized protein n=1 Tax=Phrynocephalus forsythii TaxID=171643 RepID=A0A9Q0X944_9SAUR|nr:hypothetical protein JRQ81_010768 [Phrynocephalus forsythii]
MGVEQSIQSSDVFPDLKGYRIKLTGISDVQPDGEASAAGAERATEEVFVEDELQGFPSKLEKPEVESMKEASSGEAQGTNENDSGEEKLGQTYQQQDKSDGVSVLKEISKGQILGENNQDGDWPVSVPKNVMDSVEESKMTSEIHAASSYTGDNTEGTEFQPRVLTTSGKNQCAEQACELDVGGQSFECTMAQQAAFDAHEKPPILIVECEPHLKSEIPSAAEETMNFTEVDLTTPVPGALLASPPLVSREWTSLQPSAKPQPEISMTKEPSSIKEFDKAFPGKPGLEKAEAPKVANSGAGLLSKEGAQLSTELRVTPVAHQEEVVTENTEQTQACLGEVGSPVCVEKLTDTPNEQDILLRPLISGKKKRFCCTVL